MKIKHLLLMAVAVPSAMFAVDPPTMGWSSWNTFSVNISEDIIKGQADAMVNQGLKDVGYQYINIDDGFQYGRLPNGNVRIHPQRFPNGLKVVSDYIHSKGLKAGIYSDAGDLTCGSQGQGETWNLNVGLYGHEEQDAQYYFNECEFDFIKVDYCGGIHLGLNEEAQYTKIYNAIKNTGREVRYNLCRWAYPGTWCHDISTSWRTTGDINESWESVRGILAENLYMAPYCWGGCYNDMDMLEVGRSLSAEEDQTHFGMWCIMASPLLIGCNMETLSPRALELLKNEELIALNQDVLGLQAYVVQHVGDTYILAKDVETLHGTTRAVAFYNPSDNAVTMTLSASEVDLAGKITVRDLVKHENIIENQDVKAFHITVPAHGSRFYRIEAETRLESYIYEGENGFLHDYQEVSNHEALGTAIYQGCSSANGKMYAGWLGSRRSNSILWRDVYSLEGGEYVAHFRVGTQDARSFTVVLNGEGLQSITAQTGGWETFKEYDVSLILQEGVNTIELYNADGWMPNIDCMTLEKAGTAAILDRRFDEAVARLQSHEGAHGTGVNSTVTALLAQAAAEGLTSAKKESLISEIEKLLTAISQIDVTVLEYNIWLSDMQANIEVSEESSALTTLVSKMSEATTALDEATTATAATRALSNLKSAYKAYLKSEDSRPKEGESLNMTMLINNPDFSTNSGWNGDPTYRSQCGEEYNKTFDMYQTITSMKPGIYTVSCNALYRTTHNDGGAAYKAGTEVIPAVFYVNAETTPVPSLYSEEWPDAANYDHVNNLNGYPHSMHAAAMRFAEGCYAVSIDYDLQAKGVLRLGLKCDVRKDGCWCCFDNFTISYRPLPTDAGINNPQPITHNPHSTTYNLQGQKVQDNYKGVVIKNGKKQKQ